MRLAPVLPSLLLAMLMPAGLLARAGGGGDYQGPGGDGGGGGDGDGALVWFAFRLIVWAFRVHPLFGLALMGVAIAIVVGARRSLPGPATRRAVAALDRAHQSGSGASGAALEAIRARDPEFSEAAFLARVRAVFPKVQEAWSAGDLRPARAWLSDAVWNRFQVLLAINRQHGRRNVVSEVTVSGVRTLALVPGAEFDEIHVRVDARARDADVAADAGAPDIARALARAPLAPFVEVWSFLRRAGTRTRPGDGALEGACPSCGAPLALAEVTACGHCGSLVNSGRFDWVLAEITQAEAWSGASEVAAIPGLAERLAADPSLSRQVLEDRGSLLFWRWLEARAEGRPAALRKLATPAFVERFSAGPAAAAKLDRPAVGAAALLRMSVDGEHERAHVLVRWSARAEGASVSSPRSHVLVLVRLAGTRSRLGDLASARCPQCAAPLGRTDTPRCDYCDADLAAAEGEFVLEDVLTELEWSERFAGSGRRPGDVRRPASVPSIADREGSAEPLVGPDADDARVHQNLLPDPGVPAERERLIHALVLAAAADGQVTAGERRLLRTAGHRFGIAPAQLAAWMDGALAAPGVAAAREGAMSTPLLVRGLALAALVDGRIDRRERKLLERIGAKGGLDAAEVARLMAFEAERIERAAVGGRGGLA